MVGGIVDCSIWVSLPGVVGGIVLFSPLGVIRSIMGLEISSFMGLSSIVGISLIQGMVGGERTFSEYFFN